MRAYVHNATRANATKVVLLRSHPRGARAHYTYAAEKRCPADGSKRRSHRHRCRPRHEIRQTRHVMLRHHGTARARARAVTMKARNAKTTRSWLLDMAARAAPASAQYAEMIPPPRPAYMRRARRYALHLFTPFTHFTLSKCFRHFQAKMCSGKKERKRKRERAGTQT